MASFQYTAVSRVGKTVRGILEADSRRQAVELLRERGLTPLEIETARRRETRTEDSTTLAVGSRKGRRTEPGQTAGRKGRSEAPHSGWAWLRLPVFSLPPPKSAVAAVTRQLATLLRAGLPLDAALSAICSQLEGSRMDRIVAEIRDGILEGATLADSLGRFPEAFSPTFVTMVGAAEASGTLEPVMERLADNLEQQNALRRKVQSAMAYPALMLMVGTGIVIFLLTFVIPQVTQVFIDFKQTLPLSTRFLIAAGDAVSSHWRLMLAGLALSAFGLWRFCKSERGRERMHRLLLRLPLLRALYRPLLLGQLTRTFGMLLKNGVPMVQALNIARSVTGNVLMARAVTRMHAEVQEGKELSGLMDNPLLFSPLSRQMVAAGEKSGRLAEMLLWVADDCDNQVAVRLQATTALMEPVMILILGGVVGFVVIAIILPIFQMSTLLG